MFNKFKNFIQKNIAVIISIILLLTLINFFKISSTKSDVNLVNYKVVQVDSLEKIILTKIENTTGENLFSLVNTVQKNTAITDSLVNSVKKLTDNDESIKSTLNKIDSKIKENKAVINKIDTKLNGLQSNNSK